MAPVWLCVCVCVCEIVVRFSCGRENFLFLICVGEKNFDISAGNFVEFPAGLLDNGREDSPTRKFAVASAEHMFSVCLIAQCLDLESPWPKGDFWWAKNVVVHMQLVLVVQCWYSELSSVCLAGPNTHEKHTRTRLALAHSSRRRSSRRGEEAGERARVTGRGRGKHTRTCIGVGLWSCVSFVSTPPTFLL